MSRVADRVAALPSPQVRADTGTLAGLLRAVGAERSRSGRSAHRDSRRECADLVWGTCVLHRATEILPSIGHDSAYVGRGAGFRNEGAPIRNDGASLGHDAAHIGRDTSCVRPGCIEGGSTGVQVGAVCVAQRAARVFRRAPCIAGAVDARTEVGAVVASRCVATDGAGGGVRPFADIRAGASEAGNKNEGS